MLTRGITDSICKCSLYLILAGDRGFEPRLTDPESVVLPLDESPLGFHPSKGSVPGHDLIPLLGF